MIFNGHFYAIPSWISTRTYFFEKENSRTYINNEKKHTYIQLDKKSSDLYYLLVKDDTNVLKNFIEKNRLKNEIDKFLNTLFKQGLLLIDDIDFDVIEIPNIQDDDLKKIENDFVQRRNEWFMSHGLLEHLFFELTYRCNLKCIHCYNPKNMSNIEIPFEDIKNVIDEAYELGIFEIIISGGESTTYSHFVDLIKYIRSKHLSLTIFTNGQLLSSNDALYKTLVSLYPHSVCLSLYSASKDSHDYVTTVKGSFNKTYEIIKKLRKDNVSVQIKNFLLNDYCKDCIPVKDFAIEIGAESIADISLIPTIEGDKKTFEYVVNEDNLFQLFINKNSPLYIGDNPYIFDINKNKNVSPCLGGFTGLCISPKLDVYICVSLPRPLANLKDISLKQLWEGAKTKDKNNKLYIWQNITNSDLKECYKHEYCKFCHYCAGMGFLENGWLKKSDILCMQAKAKMKAYKYIRSKKL